MDEIRTVHQCLFCPQTFGSASEKDDHILQHFAQETCIECDQHLIRIGSNLYTLHNAVTCIKVNIKTEEPICQEDQHETIDENRDENGFTAVTSLDSMFDIETKPDPIALNEQLVLVDVNNLVENCEYELDSIDASEAASEATSNNDNKSNEFKFKCSICGEILSSSKSLKNHESLTHSAPSLFPCHLCPNVTLRRKDSLRKHMKMKHDPNSVKYKCKYCPSVFLKEISLEAHLSKCNNRMKRMESELCTVTSEDMCTVQIKEEHIDDGICTQSIENGPIKQNQKNVKNPNGNDNKCDICLKTFFDKNGVRRHKIRVHSAEGTHVCACTKIFGTAEALAEHKAICEFKKRSRFPLIHMGKTFECHLCHRVIKDIISFRRHMQRIHLPCKKPHKCKKCGKGYIHPYELRKHNELVHLKIRKSLCTICGKSFSSDQVLRIHMYKHTGETPYKCPHCEKAFSNPSIMSVHLVTHTDERNFKCPFEGCDKRFKTPANVYTHKRKKHGLLKKEQYKDT